VSLTEELAAVADTLAAAGFAAAEYDVNGLVTNPGFVIEATTEPGVLYVSRDRVALGGRKTGAQVRRGLEVYARHLEQAGWLVEVKGQYLLATPGDLGGQV